MGKPIGPKKVHLYSNEFKVQAVRLSLHPDIQTQDVAKALDIHPFMLSRWKKVYREGVLKGTRDIAPLELPRGERDTGELRALKRQVHGLERKVEAQTRVRVLERKVRALEIENDLLKKAIAARLNSGRHQALDLVRGQVLPRARNFPVFSGWPLLRLHLQCSNGPHALALTFLFLAGCTKVWQPICE
jgi:transposase